MKFEIVKRLKITEKATQWNLRIDEVLVSDVWLPNKSVTVENDSIEIPEWLIMKNDKLKEVFPDFVPTEPIKETSLDVLKDIRKILKQISENYD